MSTTFEICADGHRCEHGSKCAESPIDESTYYCDCYESTFNDAYAGLYCEHVATEYCTLQQEVSHDSFCTNGGTCIADVTSTGAHLGCDCPPQYEGEHCQFTRGTKPTGWPYDGTKLPPDDLIGYPKELSGGDEKLGAGIVAVIVLIVLGVIGGAIAAYLITKRRNGVDYSSAQPKANGGSVSSMGVTPDLALEADGGVMQNANGSKATLITGDNTGMDGDMDDVDLGSGSKEEGSGTII